MIAFPSKPGVRPGCPFFSSGPSAKRPGWSLEALSGALIGRWHRSLEARERLSEALALTREVLRVPSGHVIAIVPGSDTGAVEMSLWSLLGPRGVDMLSWESFGQSWANDVCQELGLQDVRVIEAPYGKLPDFGKIDFERDVVFVWNGTSSGACVPDARFIPCDRKGLTICDATSAVFAQHLDFSKLDVVTYSWQKCLGGEAAHGIVILSPHALERLETWRPPWPIPKIFRFTSHGKVDTDLFLGKTINTPSMLCVEDYIDALYWAKGVGGLDALIARADDNFSVIDRFVSSRSWLENLVDDPAARSSTTVCLSLTDPDMAALDSQQFASFLAAISTSLECEKVAYDIGSHRDAPPGLRIWCGPTVEKSDVEALMPWLEWAFHVEKLAVFQKKLSKSCALIS